MGEAGKIFKDMNLSQDQAQALVDFYAKQSQQAAEAPVKYWQDMQKQWQEAVQNDPEIGGSKLDGVKATIGKAIDGIGDPKLATEFRQAMDFTGAGNNPAFVKFFWKLAQQLTEGSHVTGGGPSKFGQQAPKQGPASPAKALYPYLP
jgi:hypothetical protein